MTNGIKIKATLFIVLFLLLIAVIVFILQGNKSDMGNTNPYSSIPTVPPVVTDAPVQQAYQTPEPNIPQTYSYPTAAPVYVTPQPIQTQPPEIFITPEPVIVTLEPIPVPTITPQPVGMTLGSGSFRSVSGSLLDIHADWTATVADEDTATVTVTVYADHYQLYNSAMPSLYITVGNSTETLMTAEIQYDESALRSSVLGSASFRVPVSSGSSTTVPLSVKWNFGGTYGDGHGNRVDVSVLDCSGNITLSR